MPHSFSSHARGRPTAQLFAVHRLPEKKPCYDEQEDAHIDGLDDLASSIDQLVDDEGLMQDLLSNSPKSSSFGSPFASINIPPALLDQASMWGAIDPVEPLAGARLPCVLTGVGAQFETGTAVQAPGQAAADTAPPDLQWFATPAPLITHDGHNVPLEPTICTVGDVTATVTLSPQLLFWQARRQWMWHRKWSLPTISIEVRGDPKLVGVPLFVHVTAGTRPEGSDVLCDVGLLGECQSRLTLDASGRGRVQFARLLFQRTSFNCGARPFHLTVSVLADAPTSPDSAPGPGGGALSATAFGDLRMGASDAMDIGGPDATRAPFSAVGAPFSRRVLLSLCSQPIRVDARKRSKAERADAAANDVRLMCRPTAGRPQPQPQPQTQTQSVDAARAPARASTTNITAGKDLAFPFFPGLLGEQPLRQPMPAQMPAPIPAPMPAPPRALGDASAGGWQRGPADDGSEAIFVVRADSTVVHIVSPGAFGYTPQQLIGQTLASITLRAEHADLVQALQVLVRVHEITCISTGQGAGGGTGQSMRMFHHVLLGVGDAHWPPKIVAVESLVTPVARWGAIAGSPNDTSTKLLFRSRPTVGDPAASPFRTELVSV